MEGKKSSKSAFLVTFVCLLSLQPNSGKTKKGNPTMLLLQPPRSCCPSLSRGCCGPASTSAPSAPLAVTRREHHRHHHHRRRHRLVSASAASSSSSSSPEPSDAASPSPAQPSSSPQMSLADAHAALGVAEGARFDLVSAKNRALADAKGNGEKLAKVRISRMLLSFFLLLEAKDPELGLLFLRVADLMLSVLCDSRRNDEEQKKKTEEKEPRKRKNPRSRFFFLSLHRPRRCSLSLLFSKYIFPLLLLLLPSFPPPHPPHRSSSPTTGS